MRAGNPVRRILHIDLDPFFVSAERSLDPSLRDLPLVVGGDGHSGVVAAASSEALAAGVRPGQTIRLAQRLCPQASFRAGDFDTYARISQDVTHILLSASRRVERPSADEAFVEFSGEHPSAQSPFRIVDRIQDQIRRRLGLDASFGLASTRLAARTASRYAKPRGLLVLLPDYETSFMAHQPIDVLGDVLAMRQGILNRAGIRTIGELLATDSETLVRLIGTAAAAQILRAVAPDHDRPVPIAAPPSTVYEQALIRDPRTTRADLDSVLDSLVRRALKRIRPFDLHVVGVAAEVHRANTLDRRYAEFRDGSADERTLIGAVRTLTGPLLSEPGSVRSVAVRLGPLAPSGAQYALFPDIHAMVQAR